MNVLIILRAETVSLIILLFLLMSAVYYRVWRISSSFCRMWCFAAVHVVFDMITVYTVNHLDTVPGVLNYLCHMIFFSSAILFTREYFLYVLHFCLSAELTKRMRTVSGGFLLVQLLVMYALPIEYLEGRDTNYSLGPSAMFGFGCAFVFLSASAGILVLLRRRMKPHVFRTLGPLTLLMMLFEIMQIMIPEYLFTGCVLAIVMMGVFFSMENPSAVFQQQAVMDLFTGLRSRNSFEVDFQRMEEHYRSQNLPEGYFCFVYCDINDLKLVNDTFGHQTGDEYLTMIAKALMETFRSAEAHYRMGGDEFLSVYRKTPQQQVQQEIDSFSRRCRQLDLETEYPVSAAVGFALSGKDYPFLSDVLKAADYQMYRRKWEMKNRPKKQKEDRNAI